jgi:hypothetical protein
MTSIPTPYRLNLQARRLDRRRLRVAGVIRAMRNDGLTLHLEYRPTERWWLSDGCEVTTGTAIQVIAHSNIVSVGDTLFGFTHAQTYRFLELSTVKGETEQ